MFSEIRFGIGNGSGGGLNARVEAADAEHEVRVVAEGDEHTHLALERHEQQARVEQRGEEVDALLVELDRAGEVHLQDEDGLVLGRQREPQHAEDRDVARDLDDDPEREADRASACPSRASPSGR